MKTPDFDFIEKHKNDRDQYERLLLRALGLLDKRGNIDVSAIKKNYWCWSSSERGLVWIAAAIYFGNAVEATELTDDPDGFGAALRNCSGDYAKAMLCAIALDTGQTL